MKISITANNATDIHEEPADDQTVDAMLQIMYNLLLSMGYHKESIDNCIESFDGSFE